MASTNATFVPVKNQAYRWTFLLVDAAGDPVTGAAGLDSEVSKDGAAFADATAEATEIAQGLYYLDLTAGEMNADTVVVIVKTSTVGAKSAYAIFTPQEAGTELKVNTTHIGGTAQTANDVGADVNAILVDTGTTLDGRIPAALVSGRMDASVGAVAAGAITAAGIAADAIGASELAADAVNEIADGILARTLAAESYAADGAVPTLSQMLYMLWAFLSEHSISGTTWTVKKLDGSTTAMVFTLNNAIAPTSVTRAS